MKDNDKVLRSILAWDGTAAISVVLAVCAWLIEAALDAFVFHLGPLPARLLPLNDTKPGPGRPPHSHGGSALR